MQAISIQAELPGATTAPAPKLDVYLPVEGQANGAAIIIFPGGAYSQLAEHEGKGYAEYFIQAGYTCFVVEYRLGSQGFSHPAMLEDALAAIYTVRRQADEYGIDPARVGVAGSSAGGHLAAHACTAYGQYTTDLPLRPAFGILCYPVISMRGDYAHAGCRQNLHGGEPGTELAEATSPERLVTPETPPCFLWHTREDASVLPGNSLVMAGALDAAGVSYELHIYKEGVHGIGMDAPFDWGGECLRWLAQVL